MLISQCSDVSLYFHLTYIWSIFNLFIIFFLFDIINRVNKLLYINKSFCKFILSLLLIRLVKCMSSLMKNIITTKKSLLIQNVLLWISLKYWTSSFKFIMNQIFFKTEWVCFESQCLSAAKQAISSLMTLLWWSIKCNQQQLNTHWSFLKTLAFTFAAESVMQRFL